MCESSAAEGRRRWSRTGKVALGLTALIGLLLPAPSLSQETGFNIIVNVANPVSSVTKQQLSDMFLKRISKWPNGQGVQPADLSAYSAVRHRFCVEILEKPLSAIHDYWQREIFSGRAVPPPVMESEAKALAFVRERPGAISYISLSTSTEGVKVLRLGAS